MNGNGSGLKLHALVFNKTGALFIYDERYPGPSRDLVTGYSMLQKRLRNYNRSAVEGCVSKCSDANLVNQAFNEYKSWLQTEEGVAHAKEASGWREQRISETIERHSQWFKKQNKSVPFVSRESNKRHRVTHCYNCKSHLDNAISPECSACGWIICECGACGCQYEKM